MGFFNKVKKAFKKEDESQKVNNKINYESSGTDKIKNFKYLDDLIHSGVKEIILDSDISLSTNEEAKYLEGIELDTDDLVIDGACHTIDACGKTRTFKVTGKNVILKNITFKNGFNIEGGAVYVDNFAELEFIDCIFTDNTSENKGGAIFNYGEILLERVDFTQNASHSIGGAIYNEVVGDISLVNCSFTNNTSQKNGGAIINFGKINFNEIDFTQNTSKSDGGALNNQRGGNINLIKSSFKNNVSKYSGGALINFGKINLNDVDFTQNTSKEREGGAINNQNTGEIICINCSFRDNDTKQNGGAMQNNGKMIIEESYFENNNSPNGGAIYNSTNGTLNITKTNFIKNISQKDGGAINNNQESSHLEVDDCKFIENMSNAGGGAIVNWGNSIISNSEFKYNISQTNGNDINFQKGSLKLSNIKFNCIKEKSIFSTNDDLVKIENCEFKELEYDESYFAEIKEQINKSSKRNFNYLDQLVNCGAKEIKLNSDIILENGEETKYIEGIKLNTFNMVIDGMGHTIDACGKVRIFEVLGKNITLKNITLKNGCCKEGYGGAINIPISGRLNIINCSICDNESKTGGAIYCNGDLAIKSSIFSGNKSEGNGGALEIKDRDNVMDHQGICLIEESTFSNNTAKYCGGAIYKFAHRESVTITKCIFLNNTSKEEGGAIDCGKAKIFKSTFKANNTAGDGGAITNCELIEDCIFKENVAKGFGGAIRNKRETITIRGSTFSNNSAKCGNEIYNSNSSLIMFNSTISNNLKNDKNNSNIIFNTKSLKIFDCRFLRNNSNCIINNADFLEIYDTTFSENISKDIINNESQIDDTYNGVVTFRYSREEIEARKKIKTIPITNIYNGEFTNNRFKRSLIYNCGKSCSIIETKFQNNIMETENSKNIINKTNLILSKVEMKDNGRTILNEGNITIKNSSKSFKNKIIGNGQVKVNLSRNRDEFDFTYLDEKIHKGNTKKLLLEQDIVFYDYELDFYEGGIELDIDNLVIHGKNHIIDANHLSRVFFITGKNIIIKNIIFKNGHSHKDYNNTLNESGGALKILSKSHVTIENCEFIDNISDKNGGAIFNEGILIINNSNFTNNQSNGPYFHDGGGAIYDDGYLSISNCSFSKNSCNSNSGLAISTRDMSKFKDYSFNDEPDCHIIIRNPNQSRFS